MPLIRDTIDPTREREVSSEEALDLERMGLILTGTRAKTDEGLRAAAVRQVLDRQAEQAAAAAPSSDVVDDDQDDEEPPGDGPNDPGDDDPDSDNTDTDDSQES